MVGVEQAIEPEEVFDLFPGIRGLLYRPRRLFFSDVKLSFHIHTDGRRFLKLQTAGWRGGIHELEDQLFDAADLLTQATMTGDLFFRDDTAQLFSHSIIGVVYATALLKE